LGIGLQSAAGTEPHAASAAAGKASFTHN
jgi:hypothetical protein